MTITSPHEPRVDDLPRVTLDEIRHLPVVYVWHSAEPSAAAIFRVSRTTAYDMARRDEIPTLRFGKRVVVPVPALLRMLGENVPHAEVVA